MEFNFEAKVVLTLEYKKGASTSTHVATSFNLIVPPPLDKSVYLDAHDLPTKEGSNALTNTLVQGLVGNIHLAHDNGYRDSAEHLRYIIAELEKGFAAVAHTKTGKF
jgi:hypothetical protein